jgi:hypothetical protein
MVARLFFEVSFPDLGATKLLFSKNYRHSHKHVIFTGTSTL